MIRTGSSYLGYNWPSYQLRQLVIWWRLEVILFESVDELPNEGVHSDK